jgi:hypothetical protein
MKVFKRTISTTIENTFMLCEGANGTIMVSWSVDYTPSFDPANLINQIENVIGEWLHDAMARNGLDRDNRRQFAEKIIRGICEFNPEVTQALNEAHTFRSSINGFRVVPASEFEEYVEHMPHGEERDFFKEKMSSFKEGIETYTKMISAKESE